MIFDRHANLKYKYGNRQFWHRGLNMKRLEDAFEDASIPG